MPVTMERPCKTTSSSRGPGISPTPISSVTELIRARFPAEPVSVPRSRRFVDQLLVRAEHQLQCQQSGSLRANAVLLTSELATNAVVHARTWFEISVRTSARLVRVEVTDTDETIPQMAALTESAERGRGLRIVDGIASAWGVEPGQRGKTVWFELEDCG